MRRACVFVLFCSVRTGGGPRTPPRTPDRMPTPCRTGRGPTVKGRGRGWQHGGRGVCDGAQRGLGAAAGLSAARTQLEPDGAERRRGAPARRPGARLRGARPVRNGRAASALPGRRALIRRSQSSTRYDLGRAALDAYGGRSPAPASAPSRLHNSARRLLPRDGPARLRRQRRSARPHRVVAVRPRGRGPRVRGARQGDSWRRKSATRLAWRRLLRVPLLCGWLLSAA